MFCPECQAEFREGFVECSDCRISLVETLEPPPTPMPQLTFELLERVESPSEMSILQSILDSEEIDHFFQGENMARLLAPLAILEPVRLMVREDHLERARELLAALRD